MNVRKAAAADLDGILRIYEIARERMRRSGNPNQWKDGWPSSEIITRDIENGDCRVVEEGDRVCGVFSFFIGEEPTYKAIAEGEWKGSNVYGTIHRLAGDGTAKGIFAECLKYCEPLVSDIRIDTHTDNLVMRHLLEKSGFERRGVIHVEDGTPRIAYQKTSADC